MICRRIDLLWINQLGHQHLQVSQPFFATPMIVTQFLQILLNLVAQLLHIFLILQTVTLLRVLGVERLEPELGLAGVLFKLRLRDERSQLLSELVVHMILRHPSLIETIERGVRFQRASDAAHIILRRVVVHVDLELLDPLQSGFLAQLSIMLRKSVL